MQRGELFSAKPLLGQQGHGQRVAERQRHGGTGGRGEAVGARFFRDAGVEHHPGGATQGRGRSAGHRDDWDPHPLERGEQPRQFIRLATLAHQQRDVFAVHDSEISVLAVHWMEISRRRAGRGQGGGDFARDQPRFAHARNDHPPPTIPEQSHRRGEPIIHHVRRATHRLRLKPQHSAGRLDYGDGIHAASPWPAR